MSHVTLRAFVFLLLAVALRAADVNSAFAFVMVDDATEAKLGNFPYDRAIYAQAVEACAQLKAKAVVLKFFLDQARSPAGDAALRAAMTKVPTVLLARLDASSDGEPQPIPDRFAFTPTSAVAIKGSQGWISGRDDNTGWAYSDHISVMSEWDGRPFNGTGRCAPSLNPVGFATKKLRIPAHTPIWFQRV